VNDFLQYLAGKVPIPFPANHRSSCRHSNAGELSISISMIVSAREGKE